MKNADKPLVLAINALLHSLAALAAAFSAVAFSCYLWYPAKVNFARIWCITNSTLARRVIPLWNVYMAKFYPCWEGHPVWQTGLPALAGHPTYHVNVIKLNWEIVWTGGLPHISALPNLPGVPHLHVNRPWVRLPTAFPEMSQRSSPEQTAGRMSLLLSIRTNQIVACSNRAGSIIISLEQISNGGCKGVCDRGLERFKLNNLKHLQRKALA